MKSNARFLRTPAEIRRGVSWLARRARRLDLAVAFVGQDWQDAIAEFRGRRLRVICWLSSTNTNPRAVRQMMARRGTRVRQRDGMHAKVYLAPRVGVIVGSANLSQRALAVVDGSGQDEAAVLLTDTPSLRAVGEWFDELWGPAKSRAITEGDLRRATRAFDRSRALNSGRSPQGGVGANDRRYRPQPTRRRTELLRLATTVRRMDLRQEIEEHHLLAGDLRGIDRTRLERISDALTAWIKRRFWAERGLLRRPLSRVRSALARLCDESRAIDERLEEVIDSGDLSPLNVGTLSVLLHWRNPETYLPFNWRTDQFLKDFRLGRRGASAASPSAYARWLDQAEELSQELDLPTRGHVDRLVWEHTSRD